MGKKRESPPNVTTKRLNNKDVTLSGGLPKRMKVSFYRPTHTPKRAKGYYTKTAKYRRKSRPQSRLETILFQSGPAGKTPRERGSPKNRRPLGGIHKMT